MGSRTGPQELARNSGVLWSSPRVLGSCDPPKSWGRGQGARRAASPGIGPQSLVPPKGFGRNEKCLGREHLGLPRVFPWSCAR
eukprot:1675033-Pyramimonas_sp.AAC.1